jgi:hypothetical protein
MTAILIDHNLSGLAQLLYGTLQSLGWVELLQLVFVTFDDAGLDVDTSDQNVWQYAQAHRMILLTGNRNMEGIDSLEQTIRDENFAASLPVLTVSRQNDLQERAYRRRCAARLIEIVVDLEIYRGVGRLYIP